MLILRINKILNWLSITNGGRCYTCPMKEISGVKYFHFKKKWHKVTDYLSDNATELVEDGGRVFSRKLKK